MGFFDRAADSANTVQRLLKGLRHELTPVDFVLANKSVEEVRALIEARTISGPQDF